MGGSLAGLSDGSNVSVVSGIPYRVKIVAGIGLCLLAVFLMQSNGNVLPLQQSTSPEQFAERAYEGGNGLRVSSLIDAFLYVPGYVLLFLGLLGRYEHTVAEWAKKFLIGGAVADQIENTTLQLAMGRVDLDAGGTDGAVNPAGWLISVLRISSTLKWLLLALAIVAVFAVVVRASRDRVKEISRSTA